MFWHDAAGHARRRVPQDAGRERHQDRFPSAGGGRGEQRAVVQLHGVDHRRRAQQDARQQADRVRRRARPTRRTCSTRASGSCRTARAGRRAASATARWAEYLANTLRLPFYNWAIGGAATDQYSSCRASCSRSTRGANTWIARGLPAFANTLFAVFAGGNDLHELRALARDRRRMRCATARSGSPRPARRGSCSSRCRTCRVRRCSRPAPTPRARPRR